MPVLRFALVPGRRHLARALCAALLLAVPGAVGSAAPLPHSYRIDPAATRVHARVAFFGIAARTAQFPATSGAVTLQPDDPTAIAMDIVLDARNLTAGDGVTIARLKGPAFFDVARHPTVHFAGNRLLMRSPVQADVFGTITARGVTRPATLAVTFAAPPAEESGTRPIVLTARTVIDRRDFGMTAYSLIVGRAVTITIDARLQPG